MIRFNREAKLVINGQVSISGLAELANSFPDDRWYEVRIYVRKIDGHTTEVKVTPIIPLEKCPCMSRIDCWAKGVIEQMEGKA